MKKRLLFPASIATALLVLAAPVFAAPVSASPPDRVLDYTITRNGDEIGTHRVRFETTGDRLSVEHDVHISVTVLSIEAYHYDLSARETWEGDRLLGLSSTTDRNGTPLSVSARSHASGIRIDRPSGARETSLANAVPADPHWNVFGKRRTQMIMAEDGVVRRVDVSAPVAEVQRIGGRRVLCRRYDVSGDHSATLWYDSTGFLVLKRLRAPDGSTVMTRLRR